MTKLLTLRVLFLTAVTALVVAKLVILGILSLSSFILALRAAVVVKLVILSISSLTSFSLALRAVLVAKLVISSIYFQYFDLSIMYIVYYYISSFT